VLHATWQLATAQLASAEAVAAEPEHLHKLVGLLRGVLELSVRVRAGDESGAMGTGGGGGGGGVGLRPGHARAATYAAAALAAAAEASPEAGRRVGAAAMDTLVDVVCCVHVDEQQHVKGAGGGCLGLLEGGVERRCGTTPSETDDGGVNVNRTPRLSAVSSRSRRQSNVNGEEWAMVCELMAEARTQAGLALGAVANSSQNAPQIQREMGGGEAASSAINEEMEMGRRLAGAVAPLSALLQIGGHDAHGPRVVAAVSALHTSF